MLRPSSVGHKRDFEKKDTRAIQLLAWGGDATDDMAGADATKTAPEFAIGDRQIGGAQCLQLRTGLAGGLHKRFTGSVISLSAAVER